MEDPVSLTGLPTTIATAVGVFFACMAALNKWMQSQKNDVTQVTILTDDRNRWQERAEKAESAIDDYRAKLNQIIIDQSEMKAQNAVMIEQLRNLREENDELRAEVRRLAGGSNVRSIS
jgi:septal ring factor EnvC (AmiA/AmiB activator)